jgi:hypothetical protein
MLLLLPNVNGCPFENLGSRSSQQIRCLETSCGVSAAAVAAALHKLLLHHCRGQQSNSDMMGVYPQLMKVPEG